MADVYLVKTLGGMTPVDDHSREALNEFGNGDVVRVKDTMFWDAMSVFSPLAGPAVLAAAAIH